MSIDDQKAKLEVKDALLAELYNVAYAEIKMDINLLVIENAQLFGLADSSRQYYMYYRGDKYFAKEPSLGDLLSADGNTEQMGIHPAIKAAFVQKLTDLEELKEERNAISIYLSHLLTECNTAADMYAVVPSPIKKFFKLKIPSILTLTDEEIESLSIKFKKYHDMLNERVFINLLLTK